MEVVRENFNGLEGLDDCDGATNDSRDRPSDAPFDLVGGPFAVIESDPGVFTTLIRRLGIKGIEVEEVYDIQPWALDHLKPKGLILCFTWRHDNHRPKDFDDPAAKHVWFANQLSEDACASQAILNVLFNCPSIELGHVLTMFKKDTEEMPPIMKGLAISNLPLLRETQNSVARPADVRGAISAIAEATKEANKSARKPPKKKRKVADGDSDAPESSAKAKRVAKAKKKPALENEAESYHFIGYVPAHGKVWELDGLKSGPLEVGELPFVDTTQGWEDVVRPALKMKMKKYGGSGDDDGNIRFNLLALVEDRYEAKSDKLELLKREKAALERQLTTAYPDGWLNEVDSVLAADATENFKTLVHPATYGPIFAKDFGSYKMEKELNILRMDKQDLPRAWEICVTAAIPSKVAVEEEVQKAFQAQIEHVKRTYDYEPFITEFLSCLHSNSLLADLIAGPPNGSVKKASSRKGTTRKKRTG